MLNDVGNNHSSAHICSQYVKIHQLEVTFCDYVKLLHI